MTEEPDPATGMSPDPAPPSPDPASTHSGGPTRSLREQVDESRRIRRRRRRIRRSPDPAPPSPDPAIWITGLSNTTWFAAFGRDLWGISGLLARSRLLSGQKAGFPGYPGSRVFPCIPVYSRYAGIVYLWSFLIALWEPACQRGHTREYTGIHGNTGNKARRAVLGYNKARRAVLGYNKARRAVGLRYNEARRAVGPTID